MPVHRGIDKKGTYYQWGTQKKYYYTPGDAKSRQNARKRAENQGRAVYASGYKD